jgi:VPS62-like protein
VRYAPVLVLHPAERFAPVPVDGFITDSDFLVRDGTGAWVPATVPLEQAPQASRLDQRSCRAIDGPAAIDCYGAAEDAYAAPPTVYGAVVRTPSRIALQYWLFYPANVYSPTVPAGAFWQAHEGDWEAVTVLLDSRQQPVLLGASRHCAGVRREWSRVPRRGTNPVVYVAIGSHAHYLSAGRKLQLRRCWPKEALAIYSAYRVPIVDHAAAGRAVRPRIVRITATTPTWMQFRGAWGEDQYVGFPNVAPFRFGTGPAGPAFHTLWRRPVATPLQWNPG